MNITAKCRCGKKLIISVDCDVSDEEEITVEPCPDCMFSEAERRSLYPLYRMD